MKGNNNKIIKTTLHEIHTKLKRISEARKFQETPSTGLLIFRAVTEPRNSGKSTKSHEIHKNTQNTVKFGRNLIKYMSVQQF